MSETNNNSETENEGAENHGHPKPKYDDVNIPVVVLLGILSAILTFVSIAFVQGLYYNWQESMVQADWNSGIMTPQEKTIANQKEVREGYFETKDGKIYISVEKAAQKMLSAAETPKSQQPKPVEPKKAEPKKAASKSPEPPGPENGSDEKSKDAESKKDAPSDVKKETDAKSGDKK